MTLAEFELVMEGVAMRNGMEADATPPSVDDFYDDLAASYRAETRH